MTKKDECSRDMLARLYELPDAFDLVKNFKAQGIIIRRALVPEKQIIVSWVSKKFGQRWADECDAAFNGHPVSCFIVTNAGKMIGFSVYNSIALGVAGPMGIDEDYRSRRIGKALFIETLNDMKHQGYAYVILGWIPPWLQHFYEKNVGAVVIQDTVPAKGMYADLMKPAD